MIKLEVILKSAELSQLAYQDVTPELCSQQQVTFAQTLHSKKTDTQGFIAVDHINKCVFVVFRGTKGSQDILTDINFPKAGLATKAGNVFVHGGFLDAFLSVKDAIASFSFSKYAAYDIVVTGHSLGAAIATVAASTAIFPRQVELITFGSPKVGGTDFVDAFGKMNTGHSTRVVFEGDTVVNLPPLPNFRHVREEFRIDRDGNDLAEINVFKRLLRAIASIFKGKKPTKDSEVFSKGDHGTLDYVNALKARIAKNK